MQLDQFPSIEVKIRNSEGRAVRLYIMQKERPYRDDGASDCMENIDFLYGRVRLAESCARETGIQCDFVLQFMDRTDYFP